MLFQHHQTTTPYAPGVSTVPTAAQPAESPVKEKEREPEQQGEDEEDEEEDDDGEEH